MNEYIIGLNPVPSIIAVVLILVFISFILANFKLVGGVKRE